MKNTQFIGAFVRAGFFLLSVIFLFFGTALADQKVRIGAIGDSYASGEGASDGALPEGSHPEIGSDPGTTGTLEQRNALWQASPSGSKESQTDASCHRSKQAWPYKSADQFGRNSGKPVDFSSFACSGAEVPHLIESEFKGVGTGCFGGMGGQLCELEKRFEGQMVDALLVSIGGNDVGFGPTVMHCIVTPQLLNCQNAPIINAGPTDGASTNIENGRSELRSLYQRFADQVELVNQRGHTYIANVFFTEYPSAMTDDRGNLCNPWPLYPAPVWDMPSTRITGDALDRIDGREARWASETVIPALNGMVGEGAAMIRDSSGNPYGFYIGGISDRFQRHGYCARDQRFLNLLRDAMDRQGSGQGAVHPNLRGHDAYSDAVAPYINRIISPAKQKFMFQVNTAVGEPDISIGSIGLRLVWSGNTDHVQNYQVAVRPAQINGVFQSLSAPTPKWPESFGIPPRHIGTNEQGWALVVNSRNQTNDIYVSHSGPMAIVTAPDMGAAQDYIVRACAEAMCSLWSDPIRVEIINGFEVKPKITNVKAQKTGTRSIKVSWPASVPRANTFNEVTLSKNGDSWQGLEVPSDQHEASFNFLSLSDYSVTVRECTWNVVSAAERKYSKCGPWSDPVSASLALIKRDSGLSGMERIKKSGPTITRPKTPPEDYHIVIDNRLIGKPMVLGKEKKYIENISKIPMTNIRPK